MQLFVKILEIHSAYCISRMRDRKPPTPVLTARFDKGTATEELPQQFYGFIKQKLSMSEKTIAEDP